MKKFRDQLARYGLRVKETRPDGNCMFRAVADQMYGDQERHEEIRDVRSGLRRASCSRTRSIDVTQPCASYAGHGCVLAKP